MVTIAIIGASNNKKKFGYKAVRAYTEAGYEVFPINPREKAIAGIAAYKSILDIPKSVEIASFYVPPEIGKKIANDVVKKKVQRVFLNPGSESDRIVETLEKGGIEVIKACSILTIGFHPEAIDE